MAAVRSKDTQPEMMLRRELHRRGLRYRLASQLVGKPDLVFVRAKVAVFVDGDFWHGHGWRKRGYSRWEDQFTKMANGERWRAKIARNMARDLEVNQALEDEGWLVHRVLESQVRSNVVACADEIEQLLSEEHPVGRGRWPAGPGG